MKKQNETKQKRVCSKCFLSTPNLRPNFMTYIKGKCNFCCLTGTVYPYKLKDENQKT